MKRLATLDIVKGICIILVVFTHFTWSDEVRSHFLFPMWVDMAIPMCMLISGYVWTKSFIRKNIESATQAYSFTGGGMNRAVRYTIPFLIAWIIEVYLLDFFSIRSVPAIKDLLREFLCGGLGAGSYYYPILIQFIFIFPVIFLLINRYKEKGLLLCCIINVIYELLQWAYGVPASTYRLLAFRYIELVAFGTYFSIDGKLTKKASVLIFLIGFLFSYINCKKNLTLFFITSWKTTSFLTSLHVIPVFYIVTKLNFRCRILELLGKASYNIFLVQMVYYYVFSKKVYERINNNTISLFFSLFVCLLAGVIFYYIETPITKKCIEKISDYFKRNQFCKTEIKVDKFDSVC